MYWCCIQTYKTPSSTSRFIFRPAMFFWVPLRLPISTMSKGSWWVRLSKSKFPRSPCGACMRFPPFLFGFLKVHLHNHSTITVNQSSRQMTILPKPKFFEDFWGTLPFPKPPPLFDVTLPVPRNDLSIFTWDHGPWQELGKISKAWAHLPSFLHKRGKEAWRILSWGRYFSTPEEYRRI